VGVAVAEWRQRKRAERVVVRCILGGLFWYVWGNGCIVGWLVYLHTAVNGGMKGDSRNLYRFMWSISPLASSRSAAKFSMTLAVNIACAFLFLTLWFRVFEIDLS